MIDGILQNAPALFVVVPLLLAVFIPTLARYVRGGGWAVFTVAMAWQFAMACVCLRHVLTEGPWTYMMGDWAPVVGIRYYVDGLNGFVMVAVSGLGTVLALYAGPSVAREVPVEKHGLFYALATLFLVGLGGMAVTGDIFNLYVFIEITSLTSYGLIAMGRRREALLASLNYLIVGTVGATFVLLGIGHLYMATGVLDMAAIKEALIQPVAAGGAAGPAMLVRDLSSVRVGTALIMVGLSMKVALFPLHLWLPPAYALAPSAVTALVAGTATKVSAYVLARMLFTVFTPTFLGDKIPVTHVLTFFASVAIVAGPLFALAQTDVKRILAYSSVGQIAYIVLGVTLVDPHALTGAVFHIANHAALKACLFCGAGAVVYRIGVCDLDHFNGLARKMPFTAITFTVAGLSLIGVPLTGGFLAKWYLAWGAIEQRAWFVLPCILVSSLLSTIYIWRIVHRMYFGDPAEPAHAHGHAAPDDGAHGRSGLQTPVLADPPWRMRLAMVVLAAACIGFRTVAAEPLDRLAPPAGQLVPSARGAR